jgi:hypothetical protein
MSIDHPQRVKQAPTFDTLERQKLFRHPKDIGSNAPILNEFVKPHIESFNALFDDHAGNGDRSGLISLALKDIGERVVFDSKSQAGFGGDGWGNRMSSESVQVYERYEMEIHSLRSKYGSRAYLSPDPLFPTRIKRPENAKFSRPR